MVDGAVLGTTIVSLIVNGLCCAYQQKEVKEHREAMRRDVRTEYWRQRLLDLEGMEHQLPRGGSSGEQRDEVSPNSSVVSEARRRKLQHDKLRASLAPISSNNPPAMVATPTSSVSSSHQTTPTRRSHVRDLPNQPIIKTTSLMDHDGESDEDSDSEDDARCRNNSLFDADDSQDIRGLDGEGFTEISLV